MGLELHEEYFIRRQLKCPCVKFTERSTLILQAKDPKAVDNPWLHVSIEQKDEPNHPHFYEFVVSASPVVYSSPDFNHLTYQHSKEIVRQRWEWDNYEANLLAWMSQHSDAYRAIYSTEAVLVSWEMFCSNYDCWMANFLPLRVLDMIYETFTPLEVVQKLQLIRGVEDFIREKFERVYMTWRGIKQFTENKQYADWMAVIVNKNYTA